MDSTECSCGRRFYTLDNSCPECGRPPPAFYVPSADFEVDPTHHMREPLKTTVGALRESMAELGYTLPPCGLPDDAELVLTDMDFRSGAIIEVVANGRVMLKDFIRPTADAQGEDEERA